MAADLIQQQRVADIFKSTTDSPYLNLLIFANFCLVPSLNSSNLQQLILMYLIMYVLLIQTLHKLTFYVSVDVIV